MYPLYLCSWVLELNVPWEHKDAGFLKNAYWETSLLCTKVTSNSRASFWTLGSSENDMPAFSLSLSFFLSAYRSSKSIWQSQESQLVAQISCFYSVYSSVACIWPNVNFSEKVTQRKNKPPENTQDGCSTRGSCAWWTCSLFQSRYPTWLRVRTPWRGWASASSCSSFSDVPLKTWGVARPVNSRFNRA